MRTRELVAQPLPAIAVPAKAQAAAGFRPEIEGLRGLLVLLVIIFHAGVAAFEGVYFSVDIFFVVSGYLMAFIIMNDMSAGRFSVMGFYERRSRRIFPALYVIGLCSLVGAYFVMPAAAYESMAESALWVLGLAGNVYFSVSSSSYFDADMGLQPFMHLWTLGLEQQYYLLIPLCFLVCAYARRWVSINQLLVVVTLVSFASALVLVYRHEQTAFYIPLSRFWEFTAGSLLALNEARLRATVPERFHAFIADAGALSVAAVFCIATIHWAHPGPATLIPVMGALFFIGFANENSILARLMSIRPLLQLGAISYSLYLWHQVVFALGRWYFPDTLGGVSYFGLTLLSLLLAFVTYRLVEVPFRNRKRIPAKTFWLVLAASTVVIFCVANYVDNKHGIKERLPDIVLSAYQDGDAGQIAVTADGVLCYEQLKEAPCPIGSPDAQRNWALVGDSHAAALTNQLDAAFREQQVGGYAIFKNACAFALGVSLAGDRERACETHNRQLMERLLRPDIQGVVIAGRYPYFLDRGAYNNGEGGIETGRQWWFEPAVKEAGRESALVSGFVEPVKLLLKAGKRVVLVYPVPEMGWHVPQYQFKRLLKERAVPEISIGLDRYRQRLQPVAEAFDSLGSHPLLVRVRPEELMCDRSLGRCYAHDSEGRLWYRDDDHVNDAGASLLVSDVMDKFPIGSLSNRIVTRF